MKLFYEIFVWSYLENFMNYDAKSESKSGKSPLLNYQTTFSHKALAQISIFLGIF